MSRYAIWDKERDIFTPNGKRFTAEEWKVMYPIAEVEGVEIICGGGIFNGAYFDVYANFVERYKASGCDFTDCTTPQEHLDAIEAFEDARNASAKTMVTAEERIAAALEAQVMMSMPDEEV